MNTKHIIRLSARCVNDYYTTTEPSEEQLRTCLFAVFYSRTLMRSAGDAASYVSTFIDICRLIPGGTPLYSY